MIKNQKHLFIVNPKAGKGKSLDIIPKINNEFIGREEDLIIEITKYPGHASLISNEYTSKGNYRVYAVGGDGTLNEVLNGMAGSNSFLGVIPCGSGNDFIKSLYNEKGDDILIKDIINGSVQNMDLGKIKDRYFLNISSVGIDAEVVNNALELKKIPFVSGTFAYIISAVATILTYGAKEVELVIDERKTKINITLLAVANGKYYGGGMKVAPQADLKDGYFDLCLVSKLSRIKMLLLFPKLIKGTHGEIKEVEFFKGKNITVNAEEEIAVNIDGEMIKSRSVDFKIITGGINLIIPERLKRRER
jgi:YegS/Rv2252/BmrU family lipid kinase